MATLAIRPQKAPTIASKAETCIASFQQCLHKAASVHSRELSLVEDQLARFSVWTGNIRVFGSSRQSLDHRLREAPEVRDTLVALLEGINYRIKTCSSSLEALNPEQADGTLAAVDEAFQRAVGGVAIQISLLHKLSNTIRRASKEVQNLEAARAFRICNEDTEDFLRQIFAHYILDRFPTVSEAIRHRLAGTIVLRRKRILYRRSRYGSTPIRVQGVPSQPGVEIPQAQPAVLLRVEDVTRHLQSQKESVAKSLAPSATTLAAGKFHRASAPSTVSVSKTVALSSHETLVFPPAPTGAMRSKQRQLVQQREDALRQRLGGQGRIANAEDRTPAQDWEDAVNAVGEVTCPFCFYALPAWDVVDEMKWKRHVMNDLDAYVCLFEECESPEELYSHSSQWLKHMREHALRWRCASKSHGEFLGTSREEYLEHMKTVHRSRLGDAQLRLLADKGARTLGPIFKSCPLCGLKETRGSMEEHVVGHLRLLALKSLPTYEDGESGDADNASTESSSQRSRSTVRDFTESDMCSAETPTSPGRRRSRSNNGSGSGSDISTTNSISALDFHENPAPHITDDAPSTRVLPTLASLDPACAICSNAAPLLCDCEARALDTAVRQAETRMMQPMFNDMKAWVRSHAEGQITRRFGAAAAAHHYSRAREVDEGPGGVSEPAAAALKGKINELWQEVLQTYPETLDYYFSQVEATFPAEDDPAVREPPLRTLSGSRKIGRHREDQNSPPRHIPPEASSTGRSSTFAAGEDATIREAGDTNVQPVVRGDGGDGDDGGPAKSTGGARKAS